MARFKILRIDMLAYELMSSTQERLHDLSGVFVEHALLAARVQFRPQASVLGTAVVVMNSGLTITDARTRKTSLIGENKID